LKYVLIFIAVITLFTAPVSHSAPYIQSIGPEGLVSIEAENYDLHVPQGNHQWVLTSPAGASGTAMQAAPNSGTNVDTNYQSTSPRLDYQIDFVKTGTHTVWLRGFAPTKTDDSVHVGLNGVPLNSSDRMSRFSVATWIWSNHTMDRAVAQIEVTKTGLHTLNVWMREDGFILDKIVLTKDAGDTFSGFGPDESPRLSVNMDIDDDGDGFTENQGDCNDGDADIHPNAIDVCGDGIDNDCAGGDETCAVDPRDIDDDGDGFTENQGDCNDNDDEIHPNALEVCGDGIDNDCSGGDASCSGGGGGTLSCPDCDLCNGQDPCDLPKNTKITVTSSKSPTWKLDFGVGRGDDSPVIVGGGVAHNLRIPSSSSKSIDGPGKDSCCNGIGLDNHEWRWKVRGAPEECDGDPGEVNVVGKGTRADLAMKTIASRYTLVEQTSKKIVFYISGTVRTTLTDAVRQCAELGYDHTYEYADFRRTTTITPDGFTVEMAMDYDGTVGENSMWWTIAQFKNAPAFSQGILPSQVKVTDGSKTVSLAFTPHSALSLPGGITVPYTFIFPLNSPQNHRLYFDIEKYAQNSDGGNPNLYEFWHKDGDGAPSSIGNYSVVYPRWNDTNKRGFRKTTYTFEWRWRFTN
jgi:hypothetical protein